MLTKFTNYIVYNHTYKGKKKILTPNNFFNLYKCLRYLKKLNIKPLIISGGCGHGDKSFLTKSEYIISLKKLNKVLKIDKKKKIVIVQAGVNLYDLFKILQADNYFIYNIPGGKKISVGGAIAGNVHGRPQTKDYSTFAENIIYIKYIDENLNIHKVNGNNLKTKNLIGSFGIHGIIIEVGLKIFDLKYKYIKKVNRSITNNNDFINLTKKNNSFYGYINYFEKKKIVGNFTYFEIEKNYNKFLKKKISLFYLINLLKLDFIISFFINKYSLKIFYFLIFNLKNLIKFKQIVTTPVTFEDSIYFVDINTYLPEYFRNGMIEIQFSVKKKNLLKIISEIKNKQFNHSIFPIFFIVKKMKKVRKKYFFQFPLYEYCISLGYTKKQILNDRLYFKELYEIMFKNVCNLYLTKDETVLDFNKNFKNKIKKKIKNTNFYTNDFYQKILN